MVMFQIRQKVSNREVAASRSKIGGSQRYKFSKMCRKEMGNKKHPPLRHGLKCR